MTNPSATPVADGAPPRSWPGALAVLAIAACFAVGLPALNRRLPGTAPAPAGVTVPLGHGLSVVTPAGWSADLARIVPNETLALSQDASSLVATTFAWDGTEAELLARTRRLLEGVGHLHLRGTAAPFRTAHGLAGQTYAIFGERVDGRVWIGRLPDGQSGFAVRVRRLAGHGPEALREAAAVVESLHLQEAKP